jgi:hypothetical protein
VGTSALLPGKIRSSNRCSAQALTAAPVGRFRLFILIKTKVVALTYVSSTKTPALFQERCLMDAALSPEPLTQE